MQQNCCGQRKDIVGGIKSTHSHAHTNIPITITVTNNSDRMNLYKNWAAMGKCSGTFLTTPRLWKSIGGKTNKNKKKMYIKIKFKQIKSKTIGKFKHAYICVHVYMNLCALKAVCGIINYWLFSLGYFLLLLLLLFAANDQMVKQIQEY